MYAELKGLKSDVWMCDDIIVEYNECVFCFPAYDWLEDEMIVMRGEGWRKTVCSEFGTKQVSLFSIISMEMLTVCDLGTKNKLSHINFFLMIVKMNFVYPT